MLLFKLIIVILLIFVVVTLFTALYQLNKSRSGEDSRKVFKALALRIGLSVFIFVLLWVGQFFGLIESHGIYY
ncbi:MAG: DUF2909 domain-containing protein [Thiolinea sp.]